MYNTVLPVLRLGSLRIQLETRTPARSTRPPIPRNLLQLTMELNYVEEYDGVDFENTNNYYDWLNVRSNYNTENISIVHMDRFLNTGIL